MSADQLRAASAKKEGVKVGSLKRIASALATGLEYLVTGALIRLFWLFESTIDIRAWGTENLRLLKRQGENPLVVIWHGKGFIPIAYFHHENLCLYASTDRDPNYGGVRKLFRSLTLKMVERMGYQVMDASKFSSESRGVLKYVDTLRSGSGGAIAADGPGGPIFRAKPGACFLAKKTGVTLLPVGSAISAGARLDQWDHFEIPRMFCRAAVVVGLPIHIEADASEKELEQGRADLERALNRLTWEAERRIGLHEKRSPLAAQT